MLNDGLQGTAGMSLQGVLNRLKKENPSLGTNTLTEAEFMKQYPNYKSPAMTGLEAQAEPSEFEKYRNAVNGINTQAEANSLAKGYNDLVSTPTPAEVEEMLKRKGSLSEGYDQYQMYNTLGGGATPEEVQALIASNRDTSPYMAKMGELENAKKRFNELTKGGSTTSQFGGAISPAEAKRYAQLTGGDTELANFSAFMKKTTRKRK